MTVRRLEPPEPWQKTKDTEDSTMGKGLKIKVKLLIGFGIVNLLTVVVSLTALYSMKSLSGNIDNLLGTRIPQLQRVASVTEGLYASALHYDEAAYGNNAEITGKELEAASKNLKSAKEEMAKLKASLNGGKGQALLENIVAKRAPYSEGRDRLIALLKEGKQPEAIDQLTVVRPARDGYLAALKELNSYVQERAKEDGISTGNRSKTAGMVIIGLTLAALISAVLVTIWIISSILGPLNAAVETANRIADRDLTVQIEAGNATETGQLMSAMRNMVQNLREIMQQTMNISASIDSASSLLNTTSGNIAAGTGEIFSQASTVATASEEMSSTSSDIARSCSLAAESSQRTSASAQNAVDVVRGTIAGMGKISERVQQTATTIDALGTRSEQIGEIVGTIQDIADQTNLLALNAAIEAARAGEQGRGFAVVADEVRALAERTTKATREIGEMIKAIQRETKDAVHAMEEGVSEVEKGVASSQMSGEVLEQILDQVNEGTMQINQVATAAEEQTATTSEITSNIHRITEVVQRTARGAQESADAAAQLAGLSAELRGQVKQFRLS